MSEGHRNHSHAEHHKFLDMSYLFLEICTQYIAFLGAMICVVGVFMSLLNLAMAVWNLIFGTKYRMLGTSDYECMQKATFGRVRVQLGGFTALGLEVLVVADVLESLSRNIEQQTFETLGKMCAIAAFRTALSYFLGREIKEVMEVVEEEEELVRRHSQPDLNWDADSVAVPSATAAGAKKHQ
jgi:uncharacterized membrane protein